MTRERFAKLVREEMDALPEKYRRLIHNVAVIVEDVPPEQKRRTKPRPRSLPPPRRLMGLFVGTPRTLKSSFDQPLGPDYVVLYKKNIESVCRNEREIRHEVRMTIIHEFGHYFGLSEDELEGV